MSTFAEKLSVEELLIEREPSCHIHANDLGYGDALANVADSDVQTDKLRIGIIVGNGAVLSSLPNVPADLLMVVDNNSFICDWTRFTADALKQTKSTQEYRELVYSVTNSLYGECLEAGETPYEGLQDELQNLGARHFLSGEDRFDECRRTLERKQLFALAADLRDSNYLTMLGNTIRSQGGEITFANFSNVWEHACGGEYLIDSLSTLPFHQQAEILYSCRAYTPCPETMGLCVGLNSYIKRAESDYKFWKYQKSQDSMFRLRHRR